MRRLAWLVLASLVAVGCADILGLDPLGPVTHTDDEDVAPDAAAADASDQ